MRRPPIIGLMGPPKAGKTHLALTLFKSKLIDPTKVLYFDNHGSTDAYDVPQFKEEGYGVVHIPPTNSKGLVKEIEKLEKAFLVTKQYKWEAIAMDDWSEFAQAQIEDALDDEGEGAMLKVYGAHGTLMRRLFRVLHPAVSHAALLSLFWSSQEPDPQEARPLIVGSDGKVKYSQDTRKTMLRPMLKGAFAGWLPYKLDALWYQYATEVKTDPKRKGSFDFHLQLVPDSKVAVLTRWLDAYARDTKRERDMLNPTWDKVMALIEELEIEKKENE